MNDVFIQNTNALVAFIIYLLYNIVAIICCMHASAKKLRSILSTLILDEKYK